MNGAEAPPPVVGGWTFCDEDPRARARDGRALHRRLLAAPWSSTTRSSARTCRRTKGYESYGRMQEIASAPGGADAMTQFFLDLQVWGTPEQCYEKIMTIKALTGAGAYNARLQLCRHAVRRRGAQHAARSRAACCRACRRSTTRRSACRAQRPRELSWPGGALQRARAVGRRAAAGLSTGDRGARECRRDPARRARCTRTARAAR